MKNAIVDHMIAAGKTPVEGLHVKPDGATVANVTP
jgi:hypothetical protein